MGAKRVFSKYKCCLRSLSLMSIQEISFEEFDTFDVYRMGILPEKAWFKSQDEKLLGTIIRDPIDKDWGVVVLALHSDGLYRYIGSEASIESFDLANTAISAKMGAMLNRGSTSETLYEEASQEADQEETPIIITGIDEAVKDYFAKNPDKIHQLTPRQFEELIASILEDFGFEVELTKATRDGGSDIIARVRNTVCSYLTLVECKKYAPENKVGVGVVREVIGVHNIKEASKSLIVTTSFFSKDAEEEAKRFENQLELKDYEAVKEWLSH